MDYRTDEQVKIDRLEREKAALLEALQEALGWITPTGACSTETVLKARAAIAQAKGDKS